MQSYIRKALTAVILTLALCLYSPAYALDTVPQATDSLKIASDSIKFSDVANGQWFYSDVMTLAGLGAVNGYPDGSFRPDANMSRGEYVKVVVSLLDIPLVRGSVFSDTEGHWADPYIDSAAARGIVTTAEYGAQFSPDKPVSRLEMTRIAVKALSLELTGLSGAFPDTSDKYASTAADEFIILGILENGQYLFKPYQNATRAQTTTVFMRLYSYSQSPGDFKSEAIRDKYITEAAFVSSERDVYNILNHMTYEGISTLKVRSRADNDTWFDTFGSFFDLNADRAYGEVSIKLSQTIRAGYSDTTVTLTMDTGSTAKNDFVKEKSAQIISQIITDGMTPRQRATAIHGYLTANCVYDTAPTPAKDSFTAYGALRGKAVCQGYAAAFNMLARTARLKSVNVSSAKMNHMWNAVFVDGTILHLDATWDDPVGGSPTDKYLLKTPAQFKQYGYTWDEGYVVPKFFSYQ
ncbi:MAG: S-layer homology domain-containing protein [Eubacteriales bacterium]